MKKLLEKLKQAQNSSIKKEIENRLSEFKSVKKNRDKIFSELCFCLLTANFQAEKSWKIQKEIEHLFHIADEPTLKLELKTRGHRFWPQRAERIVLARNCKGKLCDLAENESEFVIRDWLVKNIKGLGMKESSHFLRNIGYENIAIIDFHIIDLMVDEGLIEKPKTITPKKYLEIEGILRNLAKKANMNLAKLDLYLWWMETGKILK